MTIKPEQIEPIFREAEEQLDCNCGHGVDCTGTCTKARLHNAKMDLFEVLRAVANDFETIGCRQIVNGEDCGTLPIDTANKVRAILGWEQL